MNKCTKEKSDENMPESTNLLIFLLGQIKNKTLTVIMLAAASLFQKIRQYLETEGTLRVPVLALPLSVPSPHRQKKKKIKINAGIPTG